MSFALTPDQLEIRAAVSRLCERFGDEYWLKKDDEGGFPHEFHRAMAEAGWLGIAMPEAYGGSGLGLAIARNVVVEHGGSIQIESRPGEGTTAIVDLPLAGVAEAVGRAAR